MTLIRVLIADDQSLVRAGFRVLVDGEPDMSVVGDVSDGKQAVALARQHHPDLILMDIRMPGLDGIMATQMITTDADLSSTRVLVLTTFDDDELVIEALRAGARGYLLKDCEPVELLYAIRVVAGGEALLAPSVTRRLIAKMVRRPGVPDVSPDVFARLTAREREVAALIAQGLSNAEIAVTLYISAATVKTHVSRAMMKLPARDRAQLVALVYQNGMGNPSAVPPTE